MLLATSIYSKRVRLIILVWYNSASADILLKSVILVKVSIKKNIKSYGIFYTGVRAEITAVSRTFLNILKEADINFVFKVLAKFGDYKDNKEIKKNCNFEFFLSNALPGWLGSDERWINPTIF